MPDMTLREPVARIGRRRFLTVGAAVETTLSEASFTGVATLTEAIETRYTGRQQWWAASWSQAPRVAWQHPVRSASSRPHSCVPAAARAERPG